MGKVVECSKCGVKHVKPDYQRNNYCSNCNKEYQRKWWQKNKLAALAHRYRTTIRFLEDLLELQGGLCLICNLPCRDRTILSIDHNHATGKIRGFLCTRCNTAIGLLDYDPDRIERAARYLRITDGD